jgi:hypothetical protein
VDDESRGKVTHRESGSGADVGLGETIHHLESAPFIEARPALNHQIGVEALASVLVCLERDSGSWIPAQTIDLELVEEGGPDQLVSVHTHPGEGDVRRPVGVDGDDMAQRTGRKKVADRL